MEYLITETNDNARCFCSCLFGVYTDVDVCVAKCGTYDFSGCGAGGRSLPFKLFE